jgi:murein DD-endopeptidase MepM/ murein hydrolase activator NlpD
VRNIPTRRIARQYEFVIRHDGGFQSSYNIVDQTPHGLASGPVLLATAGDLVEAGDTLYEIRNGGFLHFQLLHAGLLVDPRNYMRSDERLDPSR